MHSGSGTSGKKTARFTADLPPGKQDTSGNKPISYKAKGMRPRSKNKNRVRVTLPPIESYEKELEFTADGPGRVVVRLERLMGSDRIRITDTKYMATLLERLEEQEKMAWAKRRFGRIKAERNRFRQLAIDGLMEPGPDMQDLYFHPVFRVNRVLNRLAKMDDRLIPTTNLPPIVPIDPFEKDQNGRAFKSYPGHSTISPEEISELNSIAEMYEELNRPSPSGQSIEKEGGDDINSHKNQMPESNQVFGKSDFLPIPIPKSTEAGSPTKSLSNKALHHIKSTKLEEVEVNSLLKMQKEYGIDPTRNLTAEWEPFRSQLVDMVFHEEGQKVRDFYNIAEKVLGAYSREQRSTDDFLIKLNRLL